MAILTLATYKIYKGINSTTDDAKLTLIINAVNAFIEGYCGRVFTTYYNSDKIEYFESDQLAIYPEEQPLQSITELAYSTDNGSTYAEVLVEYTDYIIDQSDQSIIPLKGVFARLANTVNGIRLTYKAGYATTPLDIEQAAVYMTDYYKDEDYIPRKSMSGTSVDTVIQPDMTTRLPAHIRRVLENYRNIVF